MFPLLKVPLLLSTASLVSLVDDSLFVFMNAVSDAFVDHQGATSPNPPAAKYAQRKFDGYYQVGSLALAQILTHIAKVHSVKDTHL